MKENKYEIVEKLTECIKQTRAGSNISRIDIESKGLTGMDIVAIYYNDENGLPAGIKYVSIEGDSGLAIIKDVCKALG